MTTLAADRSGAPIETGRLTRIATWLMFAGWVAVVAWFAAHHTRWRDEVRAMAFATSGRNVVEMWRTMHGDSHPVLWYLLVRAGHALVGPVALPAIALTIGVAAAGLLVWGGPFSLVEKAVLLATKFVVFEYVVMARNYGVSMLLMFAFAALYGRWRLNGVGLGLILFLLANTNVHSAMLAGALMWFWMYDVGREFGLRLGAPQRTVLVNGVILAVGIAACGLTVYPTIHDAITPPPSSLAGFFAHLVNPGLDFPTLTYQEGHVPLVVVSALLLLSLLAFVGDVGVFSAAVLGFLGLFSLFYFVYAGGYRHCALLLAFFVTLVWLQRTAPNTRAPSPGVATVARRVGMAALSLLIGLQALSGLHYLYALTKMPTSRSRDFGALIREHPELRSAVVIADPDYLVEPLSYYAPNPVYLMRQQIWGPLVIYTNHARLDLSLDDVLQTARRLHEQRHAPVLILLPHPLRQDGPLIVREAYNWVFRTTPEQVARFQAATTPLRTFGRAMTDETYTVYELQDVGSGQGATVNAGQTTRAGGRGPAAQAGIGPHG